MDHIHSFIMQSKPLYQGSVIVKQKSIYIGLMAIACVWISGCSETETQTANENPVIAIIEEDTAHMTDLELMAAMAMQQSGLAFDTVEGQQRFREIAPQLYETLIDFYAMKHAAIREGKMLSEEEIDQRFEAVRQQLIQAGQFQSLLDSLELDEAGFRESYAAQIGVQRLQQSILDEIDPTPTDREIDRVYAENRSAYRYPNLVRASHIFLALPAGADEEQRKRVESQALHIHSQVAEIPQETFASIARQYSQDASTRPLGGDLGYIQRNRSGIAEPLLDKIFELDEGEVSSVIGSDRGYHIFWVTAHEQPLEEARDDIRQQMIDQARNEHFKTRLQEAKESMDIYRMFDPETMTLFIEMNN